MPDDLTLDGAEETFTLTVTYDTGNLYGTVIGQREIVVTATDRPAVTPAGGPL